MQEINKILGEEVKREMNSLYTEPPFMTPTGLDGGLFCREHAYHTYFLLRVAGLPAKIIIGHYFVVTPNGVAFITIDTGADHAWCCSGEICPIDLSMTFYLTPEFSQLKKPVIGVGINGSYTVRYFREEDLFRRCMRESEDEYCLYYYEQNTFSASDEKLLTEPFCFLLPPSCAGGSLADIYGKDIFAKITLHLYKLALGHIKPLYKDFDSKKAVEYIKSTYSAALPKMRELLEKNVR